MASFVVRGPFEITFEKCKGGRYLIFDDFWSKSADVNGLADEKGCYVFAIRAGRGVTPVYIGKATKSFKQETFGPVKQNTYQNGFKDYAKGTPLMFFVVHPTQRGPTDAKHIAQIEDFLIQAGVAKNPNLQNIKGTRQPGWSIKGVIRSGAGKRNDAEVQFSSLFNIEE
ncbi:MAG: hypothetical protein ACLPSW_08280 [Roseiarcus sp.]